MTDASVTLLSRALDQAAAVISRISPDQAHLPTPCTSWDVGTLVGHVIEETGRFASASGGTAPTPSAGDWNADFRAAASALLDAWNQPGALDRKQRVPGGEITAQWALDQQLTELVIHAWDMAKATGQPTDLDPELGQRALDFGRSNITPAMRGDAGSGAYIGHEVTVPADAPLYDRVAAFGGRTP